MTDSTSRAWIQTIPEDEATGALGELYAQVVDPHSGSLDSIMAVHSLHPAGLQAHFDLYRAVMRGTRGLSGGDREMIALVVSSVNECHY